MKLNNKGASFVDVLIGMSMVLLCLGLYLQFNKYYKETKDVQAISSMVFMVVHNETEKAYGESDWTSLTGVEIINTKHGDLKIVFGNPESTTFGTMSIPLEVSLSGKFVSVALERVE